jgi:hypothetical protein
MNFDFSDSSWTEYSENLKNEFELNLFESNAIWVEALLIIVN